MINESHPKYKEFMKKFEQIVNEGQREIDATLGANPPLQRDGPETAIRKKTAARVKELQKEYWFLFTSE